MPDKIIKCYIDIGCSYQGEEALENIYNDIENWNMKDCGIISMLKLEIDKEEKTSNEILFSQVLSPMYHKFKCSIGDYNIYTSCILKEFRDVDLFVTFNGRDFDIPIIINNLNLSDRHKKRWREFIFKRDRDLLDSCLLKDVKVKGGLRSIAKRLNIDEDKIIDDTRCTIDIELSSGQYINRYNYHLINKKRRNEKDIRTLPLLESKLGLLYESRSCVDKYHKKW